MKCSTMAYDQSLHSPNNPHFFQPLLPGFHTHLNIPVAFFLKHVQESNDHIKTAKLTTDASAKTWLVKVDGVRLTDGWEDFAVGHDLRIGDITIFRHEGEMVFHVTAFGPSCCDIQYTSESSHNINDDSQDQTNNAGNSSGEKRKRVKKNPRTKEDSSSDHSQFVAHVSPSSLSSDRLYIPTGFARSNGLDNMSGKEIIVLLNEEGRSWNLNMTYNKVGMQTFVRPGWRRFCAENGMKKGHHYTFKLVRRSAPLVIRLSHAEHEPELAPESSLHHSYFVGSVSSNSLIMDKLYLQRHFVTANGLEKGLIEITLKNEWGGSWILGLKHYESSNRTFLGPGWKTFCQLNGIKAEDSFMFKLVETGDKPVLLLCTSNRGKTPLDCSEDRDDVDSLSSDTSSEDDSKEESQESDKESIEDEDRSQQCIVMEKENNSLRCICSSPYSKHRFVRLSLTQSALKTSVLYLPLAFTRMNCINKPIKIMLLGKDGVKKHVVDLLKNKSTGAMRFGKGWREFCDAHGVKNIPVAFFSKHVEGSNDHIKTAKLRTDASAKTWLVEMDGLKLTDGWEDFAVAHDLRIGDIIIFRHEGKMVFHVTAFGPSLCEFQYTSASSHNINDVSDDDHTNKTGNSSGEKRKRVKKNPRTKEESSSDHSHFVAHVTPSSLSCDRLYIQRKFVNANGLKGLSEIVLKNELGGSWNLGLRYYESLNHTYLGPGWKTFCQVNGIKTGDSFMFKVVETGDKPVLLLCTTNRGKTPLDCPEDSNDVNSLSSDTGSGESQESEEESLEDDDSSSEEIFEMVKRENSSRCRASSSYSQDRFVKLTLTPRALKTYKLMLPLDFTRVNGINKPGKITLLDKDGVKKQVVDLLDQNRNIGIMRLGKGWREFCDAHGVKVGQSFLLELIWEDEEAIPVLKFCTKL
ncbi:hypothetical protein YC2023_109767 [Brassica napus]